MFKSPYGKASSIAGYGPFSGTYSAHISNGNNRNRLKQFRKFMGAYPLSFDILDCGGRNFIGKSLGITDYTSGDLNHEFRTPKSQYDIITCFEVINHLMNHKDFLLRVHKLLKPGGKFYLSTPKPRLIVWPHGEGNYVEIYTKSMRKLLKYCGFTITKEKVYNPWPWWFPFKGIRPPFRWLLNRYVIFECVK